MTVIGFTLISFMKTLITILLATVAFTATKAQVKLNTPIPAIYWMADTTITSTGTFKTSTAMLKRRGFVVYTSTPEGKISFTHLDINKKPVSKIYCVVKDDQGSEWIAFRSTIPKPFKSYLDTTRFRFINDSTITIK